MGQNIRSYIFKIRLVAMGILCLFFVVYPEIVLGYSKDDSTNTDCAACHALRKSRAKRGTWAIRNDKVRAQWVPGEPLCDVCHTDKREDFSRVGVQQRYPSAHPVAVLGRDVNDTSFTIPGKQVFYCTNCHDAAQADRGVHSTYVSIYRLRSKGVGYGDPDPSNDTFHLPDGWFSSRSFGAGFDSGVILFGKIDHKGDSAVFNPRNSREANKERTDFNTLGLRGTYFCLSCHDSNGFPKNPTNLSDTTRINPPYMDAYYNNSDGDDSVWTEYDGGHTIRGESTFTALIRGDKLPCVDCHDSHSSNVNEKILSDIFAEYNSSGVTGLRVEEGSGNGSVRIPRVFCLKCHTGSKLQKDSTFLNKYYSGGVFSRYEDTTANATSMEPKLVSRANVDIPAHDAQGDPTGEYPSCYSYTVGKYYEGGCHKDPHSTRVACEGCHKDHAYYQDSTDGYIVSHPVDIDLTDAAYAGIYAYYQVYGNKAEVPLVNNEINCLTCHNNHSASSTPVTDSTAPQTQGLLRGDAGVTILANLDSVKIGVGNNYKNHDPNENLALKALALSSGGMSAADFSNMRAMPELCINCHYRVVGVINNHGGFSGGNFGYCDKCHSMHGRHREPPEGENFTASTLTYPLRYGMFTEYNNLNFQYDLAYQTTTVDGTTTKVYQDVSGMFFSNFQADRLIHSNGDRKQHRLCQRCHGNVDWKDIVDTATQTAPPQMFYKDGERLDSLDFYYSDNITLSPASRNKSSHRVDLTVQPIPGYSNYFDANILCSSGPNGEGCHNPHGNDNYAQLNTYIKIGGLNSPSPFGTAIVSYKGGGTKANYVSGISTFCSLCHDYFGMNTRDSTAYDSSRGRYTYTRHPTGKNVSLLSLYPDPASRAKWVKKDFFDKLVLDFDSTKYPVTARLSTDPYPFLPSYQDFLGAPASDSTDNFVVSCITCHYAHGSNNMHNRKFSDTAVIECVGCHSKSPDILRYW